MPRNPTRPRRSNHAYDAEPWLTEPGVKVKVQVVDVSGQNAFNRDAPREWRSCQKVQELIPFVNDNRISLEPWEDIALTQSNMVIGKNVLLGCLVDGYRTVRLTVECVTVFSVPEACVALSKARLFRDAGDLLEWHKWMKFAKRVENGGET